MDIKELKQMNKEELREKSQILKEDLRTLRFKASANQLNTNHEIKKTRRTIARILTVLKSKETKKK